MGIKLNYKILKKFSAGMNDTNKYRSLNSIKLRRPNIESLAKSEVYNDKASYQNLDNASKKNILSPKPKNTILTENLTSLPSISKCASINRDYKQSNFNTSNSRKKFYD